MTEDGIPCMLMRGGTSKGAYFLREDLPTDPTERDDLLLRLLGSPDRRQIDGIGGGQPLTSKVAVVAGAEGEDVDVDYHFLQVGVGEASVSDRQNCGNLLAGVGPFAVERGLLGRVSGDRAGVRVRLLNTGGTATVSFPVEHGQPRLLGDTTIAGVPFPAAAIQLTFHELAGSSCGSLLPTGNVIDEVAGVSATLVDNGMPVVVMRAADLGVDGHAEPRELEDDTELRERLEAVRRTAGPMMGLGDVEHLTVPKLTLTSPPRDGAGIATRTFIPHRCHDAIGVLGAISVATAAMLPDGPAAEDAHPSSSSDRVTIEHPTGAMDAVVELDATCSPPAVRRSGVIRTARKLMDGRVFPRAAS